MYSMHATIAPKKIHEYANRKRLGIYSCLRLDSITTATERQRNILTSRSTRSIRK